MAVWLNSLPWKKLLTWYPEISNSHAVIIVRSVHAVESADEETNVTGTQPRFRLMIEDEGY